MNKEDIGFAIVGIVLGLVIGFYFANLTQSSVNATQQAANSATPSTSVNSGAGTPPLPANHPAIDGKPMPAGPLPSDATTGGAPNPAAGDIAELPSLEPLPAGSKEKRAEQEYKNIQLLKGIPAERLMKVMFAFKSSLNVDCDFCHIKDAFEKDDKPMKLVARKMIKRMNEINSDGAGGRVTCYTCHRGQKTPAQ
ncbi:MAG: photosynthetic reaction center cytochrome c subunit [Acidobacteria bacterium]|nr:photosynthetic reaction center cytochrome c subunit [Acidobacteriota bacterium]